VLTFYLTHQDVTSDLDFLINIIQDHWGGRGAVKNRVFFLAIKAVKPG
jgi:hypothetical protein